MKRGMSSQHEKNRMYMKLVIRTRQLYTLKFSSGLGNIKNGFRSSSGGFSGVETAAALSYVSM